MLVFRSKIWHALFSCFLDSSFCLIPDDLFYLKLGTKITIHLRVFNFAQQYLNLKLSKHHLFYAFV